MSFFGIQSDVNDAQSLLDDLTKTVGLGGGATAAAQADFLARIQPASFRGVPFGVVRGESSFGRGIALHEYPYRDTQWPEDMGRATRRFSIQGFLITNSLIYGGGNVIDQRAKLIAAAETKGAGTLIHPTLGRLQVSIPDQGLRVVEQLDGATYMEFTLACYEAGERTFPDASVSQSSSTADAANNVNAAASQNFQSSISSALQQGAQVIRTAVATADKWVGILNTVAFDATGIFNLAASLPGDFGRFFNGALAGYAQALVGPIVPLTLESLVFSGTQARADVQTAGDDLITACSDQEPDGPPAAAQAAAATLAAAIVNPADGIRLFTQLASFYPADVTGPSVVGVASATMQTAMGALLRRTSLAALVRVTQTYQPSSEDDASQVRLAVCDLLDQEALIAGDTGDDASYSALCAARGAVAADLDARGGQLPPMRQFTYAESLPSLVLAQRLYQDATRADQLVSEANPRHPGFMPLTFKALSS